MFLSILKHVFYLVNGTRVYPHSFIFLLSELDLLIYMLSNIFQHYTHYKALTLHFISDLD